MADNLLDMFPAALHPLERDDGGNPRVAIPKFRSGFGRIFCRLFGLGETIFVKLDEIGEHIYIQCNGQMSVRNLVEDSHRKFGASIEPVTERVCEYIRALERNKIIAIRHEPADIPDLL